MKLLTSQKDKLYELIENIGLSPTQFHFNEQASKVAIMQLATVLSYNDSDYYFSFETSNIDKSKHYAIFCPGQELYVEHQYPGDWNRQLHLFNLWLSCLARELSTPDRWSRLEKEMDSIKIGFSNDEGKFSVKEFQDLEIKMAILKEEIKEIGLLPEQCASLHVKLDHLTEMAKELGKYDWKSLFIGTMASAIIQLSLSPENAKTIWGTIKHVFTNYILP